MAARIRLKTWLAAVVVPLLFVVAAGACSSPTDEEQQRAVLDSYVAAVQAADATALAELVTPGVDATEEIAQKLAEIGDRQWHDLTVEWRRGEFAGFAVALLRAVDAEGRAIVDVVEMGKVDDDWYVAIGSAAGGPPTSSTSR